MFERNIHNEVIATRKKNSLPYFFIPHSESPISIMLFHINTSHSRGRFLIFVRVRYHLALLAD